ncbi:MAG: cupredoxin domain-containing protein [Candidatus Levyibacteriota bacterium]
MNKLIVTLLDLFAMGFVYWFFLMKNENATEVGDSVDIIVEGGYSPATVAIQKGKTTKINFIRKDPSSCLEEVVIGDFKTRKFLPLNKKVTVEVKPQEAGEVDFACGMNMYHGKIIVK